MISISAASNLDEFVLVELQGKIEVLHPDQVETLFLLRTSQPAPMITVGNQQLTGKRIQLDKPFGVFEVTHPEAANQTATEELYNAEMNVVEDTNAVANQTINHSSTANRNMRCNLRLCGLVREKLLFDSRPTLAIDSFNKGSS